MLTTSRFSGIDHPQDCGANAQTRGRTLRKEFRIRDSRGSVNAGYGLRATSRESGDRRRYNPWVCGWVPTGGAGLCCGAGRVTLLESGNRE